MESSPVRALRATKRVNYAEVADGVTGYEDGTLATEGTNFAI